MTNLKGSSFQLSNHDEPINFSREIPVGSFQFMEEPDVKEAEEKNLEIPGNYFVP